jgi:DNA-binding transcriptional ArsR family regulator/precorrin-6B methylase 2
MPNAFASVVAGLRAAAEPTRLRLLVLLARAELSVGEICDIVGQSQPRVSRHLKLLCDAGLLDRFRELNWIYYRVPSDGASRETVQQLIALIAADDEVLQRDRERMEQVIAERARQAAQQLPAEATVSSSEVIDAIVLDEVGEERVGVLLDVGTGAGHLLSLLGAKATRAVGVDISSDALKIARAKVHSAGLSHCELQRGDMYQLPFAAPSFDTVTADRVLGDAARPVAALTEMARTLNDGGRLIVIEDFDQLSEAVKDNPIATLCAWFKQTGLECTRMHPVDTEHARGASIANVNDRPRLSTHRQERHHGRRTSPRSSW